MATSKDKTIGIHTPVPLSNSLVGALPCKHHKSDTMIPLCVKLSGSPSHANCLSRSPATVTITSKNEKWNAGCLDHAVIGVLAGTGGGFVFEVWVLPCRCFALRPLLSNCIAVRHVTSSAFCSTGRSNHTATSVDNGPVWRHTCDCRAVLL